MTDTLVIGAGVVGLACAAALQREGHAVTIVDPRAPGEYCSFGNAGCFSRGSVVPLGLPGLWKKVPGYLLDPAGPLTIRWRYLPRIAPWLVRFVRASAAERVDAASVALHALHDDALAEWRTLAAWAGVPELVVQKGHAFAYTSVEAFAADALGRALRVQRGVRVDVLTGPDVHAFEPLLAPDVVRLVVMPDQGHTPNPLRLSQAIAARLAAGGARFVRSEASGFDLVDGRVRGVVTASGTLAADTVVVAAGAHSAPLAAALGAHVPLDTERGYHVMLAAPSAMPGLPVMSGTGKFYATPMEGGLRVAGTVEFAGLDAPPDWARTAPLEAGARALFPGVTYGNVTRWMGHRPSLPDSLPVLGTAPAARNAWFAFGHGHTGLTAAAPTARFIADLVAGRTPALDPAPYRASRFARS
ncbi:MAG: FAD-dependent oxidoreductase [Proteobacteria bacterium]|nr:FAD-dependent oxidoreductase [Pseudomonadota bacterium]